MTTPSTSSPTDDILDPERIRSMLPESYRETFLAEYRAAAETAMHDPAQWGDLRWLLHTWRLRAIAYDTPGYWERRREAADPNSTAFIPARDVIPEWPEVLAKHGLTEPE